MTNIKDDLTISQNKNYVFDLSHLGCINVMGNKACEFLQGQLSCDVRDVTVDAMRQGAMCNVKGRVLALLDVLDWHGFHLILPNDLLEDTQKSLAKTALFSHVRLELSNTYAFLGFYLQNREDLIPFNANLPDEPFAMVYDDRYCCYHLGLGYYIFMMDKSLVKDSIEPFNTLNQMHNSWAWRTLQLYQHRIEIHSSSRGIFLPHRLDLHKQGYLSFDKGCYKGQEIIARMQYRSKPKHEMKLFTFKTEKTLQPGQRLLAKDGDVELGEVVDFSLLDKNTYLLAASVIFDCPADFRIASPQLL